MSYYLKKINRYISIAGIVFSVYLSVRNLIQGDYCPPILGIPACYIVLIAFLLTFISTRMDKGSAYVFIPGGVLGLILAVIFSFKEMVSKGTCPDFFGIALCYVSLIVFAFMFIFFLIYSRKNPEVRAKDKLKREKNKLKKERKNIKKENQD
jgi:FtsH-binding integral membrane protein